MNPPPPATDPGGDPETGHPLDRLLELIRAGDAAALHAFLTRFHPSDLADLLEELDEEPRREVLLALASAPALAAEALAEMEPGEHQESLAALEPAQIASLVLELSDDDAADIIGELEPEEQARVLAALPSLDAGDIRSLLSYDEESAGGLMTTELVAIDERLTAAEAIEEVRRQAQMVGEFYSIFVIDAERRLRGTLPLQALVTAAATEPVRALVEVPVAVVRPGTDQEEVGRVLSRYNLVAVPVVDALGRLLGRITFDDVLDVLEAETTEDILRFGGVSEDEEIRGGWWDAVRYRTPWLLVNLCTAFAAATVVVVYQGTVAAVPVLAAWMPIIAGMGGNAGTQALAVTVRRLALSRETAGRRWSIVGKEALVGATNGLVTGSIALVVALVLHQPLGLALVVLLAMWGNLVVAGFAGAFVPILLERLGVDPAVASSIFVTTFTDMIGFLLLLGLVTNLLL